MDATVIVGLIIWAAVVVALVNMLLATAKWEDEKKRAEIENPALGYDSESCFELCMKDLVWSPGKKSLCAATCGL